MKLKYTLMLFILLNLCHTSHGQFLMDLIDTSKDMGKGMLAMYQKFDHIRVSGYMQPQFQVSGSKGIKSFSGGDFNPNVNNRFLLRRGRIRFDYIHFAEKKGPSVQFVFQFDGTERGVAIRDFWGRFLENRFNLFALTAGMFARPFSYELNLSSSDRESPERGRLSQLLLKTERDLGAMVSFEPRKKDHPLYHLKFDVGVFNGQGLAAPSDFDSHKDIISRLSLKPVAFFKKHFFSTGLSYLNGGLLQNTAAISRLQFKNGQNSFVNDTSASNIGSIAPRKYYGADAQFKFKTRAGFTELRAEFVSGRQSATKNSTETPAALLSGTEGYYVRDFNGAYFYFLHNIKNQRHQLVVKYDWCDPNVKVAKNDIGNPATNFTAADIKYTTLGFGYINYINPNFKAVFWYDLVKNENTLLPGFTNDLKDNVFTCRLQFRF
ncbi:MAG: porin [Ferruginibacter sp.]